MLCDRYTFDGLDLFGKRLRRVARDVGYLVVWDRTDRKAEDTLGRFELNLRDTFPYLLESEELFDQEDDEDEEERAGEGSEESEDGSGHFGSDDPDEEPDEPDDEALAARAGKLLGRSPGPADFAVAALRWVRDIAIRNMGGEELRRYRVRAYAPKGHRVVETASFSVRDDDARMELALLPVGQLQGVNNAMLGRMHRQLDQSRDQVDQLVAAILTHRATEAELAEQRRSSERSEDTRTVLAQQALHQLGEAAKAFLSARGVTPELADALGAIGQSPELVATLNDPDVRVLMHDPGNLKMLAGMLKQAAAQARAFRDGATDHQAA